MRTLLVYSLVSAIATSALAHAETYKLSLDQRVEVMGKMLTPGEYRLEIDGDKACFRKGKSAIEVPVRREPMTATTENTEIRYATGGTMRQIVEIMPKGATVRLSFRQ